jgi:hypothetical protein
MCSVCGILVRASARGIGTGVDVGAAASKSSSCGVSSLPARADGSSARVVRGLGVDVSCCGVSVFASFSYKLVVWVLRMSLNISVYLFSASFSLKTGYSSSSSSS